MQRGKTFRKEQNRHLILYQAIDQREMDAIRENRPIGVEVTGNIKSKTNQLFNVRTYQKDFEKVQQGILDSVSQYIESNDVELDFEIDYADSKLSIKVVDKTSGKIIREIPVKPKIKIDMFKGAIFQAIV